MVAEVTTAVDMAAIELRRSPAFAAAVAFIVALLALAATAFAFTAPERTGWVTDEAGILDSDTAAALAARLSDLQRKTGDEVVVVTLKSLQGASIETWGNVLGESWSIGRAGGRDAGALLIVAPNDRKVRIAVGYGLGNRISDAIAEAIIADHILPYFRQGDFVQGVKSGVSSIVLQLDRGAAAVPGSTDVERGAYPVKFKPPSFWQWLRWKLTPSHRAQVIAFWVVVVVIVLAVMMMSDFGGGGWYGYNDYSSSSWSSGGWSSSGGGGFSSGGGGGGSFGGGATGSW